MLRKIVIRNVGVLRAFDTPGTPKLNKLSLFYGRNGRGKSTLTSVLRSAQNGEAATVLGRQSLGNSGALPKVALVSSAGNFIFEDGRWNTKSAPIEVFDTAFIADNVYAGELVDLSHDRGLFSIIIGANGVRLAKHLERFNAIAKKCGSALKDAGAALVEDVPADMNKEEFFALGPSVEYASRLDVAERTLKAVQQAGKIAALKALDPIHTLRLPCNLALILASTVADIDASARKRMLEHFQRFSLDKRGEAWIHYGIEHIRDDACPFCGRNEVDAAGMVTLYGQIFGESYKAHLTTITGAAKELEECLGDEVRSKVAERISANVEHTINWGSYVALNCELPDLTEFIGLVTNAYRSVKMLLERKRFSPLEIIDAAEALAEVDKQLSAAHELLRRYNAAVQSINELTQRAVASSLMTESAAIVAVNNSKRRLARHDSGVQGRIDAYYRAKRRDDRARNMRTKIQKALKKANEEAAEHYYQRVNHYLGRFAVNFTISKITNSMQGNAGQADYGLLIRGEVVARGRGRTVDAVPSFRNTLSAGDKTTLALAFFLSKLDHDPRLDCKTLVIDDPLSSHDSHRRRETVNAINDLCARCQQIIVLSHDEFLLRDVQLRCVNVPCAAFKIDFSGGDEWSTVSGVDLDQLCRAGHTKMVDEIVAFVDQRHGEADDVVLKVRQVLETHYRRSYVAYFAHNLNLGQIVWSISQGGLAHPCHRDWARLDNCNNATCDRHHGDDAIVVAKRGMDPDELRVIARDALELIGARRPAAGLN